ncbi:hypothetical protein V6N13_130194 [Hibiscus sabdariffa]
MADVKLTQLSQNSRKNITRIQGGAGGLLGGSVWAGRTLMRADCTLVCAGSTLVCAGLGYCGLISKFLGVHISEEDEISNYPQGLVLIPHGTDDDSVVVGHHIRGRRLRASAAGDEEVDLLLPGTARYDILNM